MNKLRKYIILEDNPYDAKLIQREVKKIEGKFDFKIVSTKEDFSTAITSFDPDIILSDYSLGPFDGLEALEIALRMCPDIPFIIITGSLSEETAVACMKKGAWDYVLKDKLFKLDSTIVNVFKLKTEIDEKRSAELALRESEEKFRNITEQIDDMIFLTDDKGTIKYISPASESIFGYTPEEMEGKLFINFLKKTEIPKAMKEFLKTFMTGQSTINLELLMKHKSGRIFSGELNARQYNSDSLKGTIGAIRDITKRKEAVDALRESEELFRKLITTVPDIIIRTDLKGNIVFTNDALLNAFPTLTSDMVIGKNMISFISEKDRARTEENTKLMFERPLGIQEYQLQIGNGKYFDFAVNGEVLRDSDSQPTGMVYVLRDITESKLAEKKLLESENRFKALHNASFGGIAIHDNGKILECNKGLSEITGYKTDELLGMDGLQLISEESRKMVVENIQNRYEEPYEAEGIRKNGEKYSLQLEAREIPYKGKNVRVVEFRDITERKKIDQELRESKNRLEFALTGANAGSWSWNIKTGEDIFDERWCGILGYKQEELKQEVSTWENLIHPDDKDRVVKVSNLHIQDDRNEYKEEYRMKCKNGEWKWIYASGKIIERDSKGDPVRMTGIIIDIDKLKKTEEELKKNEEQLRNIFENSTNMYYSQGTDHVLSYVSPQVYDLLGYTQEEALDNWNNFVSDNPINKIGFNKTTNAIKTGNRQPPYELELVRKDGRKILVEVRESPLLEDGKTVAIVGSVNEITERKKTEDELTKRMIELEIFNDAAVDRELVVNDLRDEVNKLLEKLGEKKKYDIID